MISNGRGEGHLVGFCDDCFMYSADADGISTGGVNSRFRGLGAEGPGCFPWMAIVLIGCAPWKGAVLLKGIMGNWPCMFPIMEANNLGSIIGIGTDGGAVES